MSPDHLGAVGSYASFFGVLLVATILAFQEIFTAAYDLAQRAAPGSGWEMAFAVLVLVFFGAVFVVIPSIPVVVDIRAHLLRGERRTALMLIFIVLVYDLALVFQLTSTYRDSFGS